MGVAALILAWAWSTPWQTTALWFALACVGQAVSLQLILAGPDLRYQHYQPLTRQSAGLTWLLLAFLLFQSIVVVHGLWRRRRALWGWGRRHLAWWQAVCIFFAFALASTVLSANVVAYANELLFAVAVQLLNLTTVGLLVWSLPAEGITSLGVRFESILGSVTEAEGSESQSNQPKGLDRFALMAAVWVTLLALLANLYAYEQHPHVPDEVAYLIQAQFYAAGVVTLPTPPVPPAFDVYLMQFTPDRWYSSMPPGWPAALAVGTFFGVPWLVNPLLAGVNILLIYLLLLELFSHRVARLSLVLIALSPWYIFLGMSFMSHMWTLTCVLFATLGVVWCRRYNQARWAWLGGFALGIIALIRPLEAVGVALLLGLWAIGIGGKRLKLLGIAGLVLGAIIAGSLTLLYNTQLTGDPIHFPVMTYMNSHFAPNANSYGFGPDRGMGWEIDPNPGHSPVDALINSNLNIASINTDLFGWSSGSLFLIIILIFMAKPEKGDYLLWSMIAMTYGLHFFYYFSGGPDFGARYWFLMFVPLIVLSVRGIHVLARKVDSSSLSASSLSATGANTRVLMGVFTLCFLALVTFVPWRLVDKYHHFRGMRPDIGTLVASVKFANSLVLIQGEQHPDYASAILYNPLDLNEPKPIFVWDRDAEVRARLLETYPDRPVWIVQGPSITQRGYEIVAGPLTAQQVAASGEKSD